MKTLLVAGLACCAVGLAIAQGKKGAPPVIIDGNWSGSSICTDLKNFPTCKNQKVVFKISQARAARVIETVEAFKIVDGKEVSTGSMNFHWDRKKNNWYCDELTSQKKLAKCILIPNGSTMTGRVETDPEGKQIRKIELKKM